MVAIARRVPDRRLQAAYRLAAELLARRHDQEYRDLAVRLLRDEEVDGVRLTAYLRRLARRRAQSRPAR
jgi:hypothetical protein